MRKNAHQPLFSQRREQRLERHKDIMGKFEKHVTSMVAQREHVAALEQPGQFWLDPYISTWEHGHGHSSRLELCP